MPKEMSYIDCKEKLLKEGLISKFNEIVEMRFRLGSLSGKDGIDKAYKEIIHSLHIMQSLEGSIFNNMLRNEEPTSRICVTIDNNNN